MSNEKIRTIQDETGNEWEVATSKPDFHNFEQEKVLVAQYVGEHEVGEGKDAFKAQLFVLPNGREVLVKNWQTLEKAINSYAKPAGLWFRIEHLGKVDLKGNKTFNKLHISTRSQAPQGVEMGGNDPF